MNVSEAAAALSVCSSFDRRTVGEADAQAWAAALPDVRFEDARDAIVAHYRETREWIMPADVLRRVRLVRRERLVGIAAPTPPAALADDPRAEQRWARVARNAIASGATEQEAAATACRAVGIDVPTAGPAVGPPSGARAALARVMDSTKEDE
ncbi:hypothetical protein [Nocardioides nanhaiensis]|uniref:DUF222 domain-containing protein n=1 Tax=Nocardioides nanhaiensis TaxID=1476871 RepID=A0ABP8W6C8_9ACTN